MLGASRATASPLRQTPPVATEWEVKARNAPGRGHLAFALSTGFSLPEGLRVVRDRVYLVSMNTYTVVRIGSHRANAKFKRLVPNAFEVYENSFTVNGYFAFVPAEDVSTALSITGITRVRDQNIDHYSPCIRRD